jgi:hypothetical protein
MHACKQATNNKQASKPSTCVHLVQRVEGGEENRLVVARADDLARQVLQAQQLKHCGGAHISAAPRRVRQQRQLTCVEVEPSAGACGGGAQDR